jgi:hypothetical protein
MSTEILALAAGNGGLFFRSNAVSVVTNYRRVFPLTEPCQFNI